MTMFWNEGTFYRSPNIQQRISIAMYGSSQKKSLCSDSGLNISAGTSRFVIQYRNMLQAFLSSSGKRITPVSPPPRQACLIALTK